MSVNWYRALTELETSPYAGLTEDLWRHKTNELAEQHPLESKEIVDVVIGSWDGILNTRLGAGGHQIGVDVFPSPQIMAFLLHELVPLGLAHNHPGVWRRGDASNEKDVVYVPQDFYSFEIKASSSRTGIFGNRSYAQPSPAAKKHKAGYYLAVNFEKFDLGPASPKITQIRIGWLDHTDLESRSAPPQVSRQGSICELVTIS